MTKSLKYYYMSNGEQQKIYRQKRKDAGLCINCPSIAVKGEVKCFFHKNKQKIYYLNNKKKFSKYSKSYRAKHIEQIRKQRRNNDLRKKYGMSHEEYQVMYQNQKGLCFICHEFKKILFIDHCHKNNGVRALLCSNCNTMLGLAKENIEILRKAINYLSQFN